MNPVENSHVDAECDGLEPVPLKRQPANEIEEQPAKRACGQADLDCETVYTPEAFENLKRNCKECKAEFPWTGEDWKTYCETCYAGKLRACKLCDNNINIAAKSWVKICTDCYVKKKSKTHDVCPLCTGKNATHLRKRFDQPCCDACAAKAKFFLSRPPQPKAAPKEQGIVHEPTARVSEQS